MILKTCPCCRRQYHRRAWRRLPLLGVTDCSRIGLLPLEQRRCVCTTALGVRLAASTTNLGVN